MFWKTLEMCKNNGREAVRCCDIDSRLGAKFYGRFRNFELTIHVFAGRLQSHVQRCFAFIDDEDYDEDSRKTLWV